MGNGWQGKRGNMGCIVGVVMGHTTTTTACWGAPVRPRVFCRGAGILGHHCFPVQSAACHGSGCPAPVALSAVQAVPADAPNAVWREVRVRLSAKGNYSLQLWLPRSTVGGSRNMCLCVQPPACATAGG